MPTTTARAKRKQAKKTARKRSRTVKDAGFEKDEEICGLLPVPTPGEVDLLEASIKAEGCHTPLVVWDEKNVLIDGYNRLEICTRSGIPYQTRRVSFPDRAAAIRWVIDNQLGRRNLSDEMRAYYIGKEYLSSKGTRGGDRTRKPSPESNGHVDGSTAPGGSTAERVGDKHKVSAKTVERAAEFAAAVDSIGQADPTARETILAGTSGKTMGEVVAQASPKKRKKSKTTPATFPFHSFDADYGRVVRALDTFAGVYPAEKKTPEFKACEKTLDDFRRNWDKTAKRAKAAKPAK